MKRLIITGWALALLAGVGAAQATPKGVEGGAIAGAAGGAVVAGPVGAVVGGVGGAIVGNRVTNHPHHWAPVRRHHRHHRIAH